MFVGMIGTAGAGEPPRFGLPVRCAPGKDCWVVNYFDHDPGTGWRDHACGGMSYDGHNGIVFAVRDLPAVAAGVAVVAARAGRVAGTRDGMTDSYVSDIGKAAVADRECGNGVRIVHGDGWETQYCHLRRGSVQVKDGQAVDAGTVLGMVGMSGAADFPHLHFGVRLGGKSLDPFTGEAPPQCEAPITAPPTASDLPQTLWQPEALERLSYGAGSIANTGIAISEPDQRAVARGEHRPAAAGRDAPLLALWVEVYGVAQGDRIEMRLLDPRGQPLAAETQTVDRAQIRRFRYIGRRMPAGGWQPGRYVGQLEVIRGRDGAVSRQEASISIN